MSEIKFFYLRDEWVRYIKFPLINNEYGNIWTAKAVRGNPFGCIAYERREDTDNPGHDYVLYAFSVANSKDKFNKELGRKIAEGRLASTRCTHRGFVVESTAKSTDVLKQIMFDLVDDPKILKAPRARKSIESWFNMRNY